MCSVQIGAVVAKLSAEMAAAEHSWQEKLSSLRAQLEARALDDKGHASKEAESVRAKYMASVEVQSQVWQPASPKLRERTLPPARCPRRS